MVFSFGVLLRSGESKCGLFQNHGPSRYIKPLESFNVLRIFKCIWRHNLESRVLSRLENTLQMHLM